MFNKTMNGLDVETAEKATIVSGENMSERPESNEFKEGFGKVAFGND